MIGRPLRRLEDPRLITGRGRYVDDISPEGTWHAVLVRSQEAHALLGAVSLDPTAAGRALFFTAADLGVERPMPVQNPSPLILQPITPPPLAGDEVCYVGQPIAVVVAPRVAEAVDAAEGVEVHYQPLPAVVDHRLALDPDSPPVHQNAEGNLVATLEVGFGDVEAALSSAPHRLHFELDQHRGALASLEGRAVLAAVDPGGDGLTMWTSTQAPHAVRNLVAPYLGLSPDQLRVIAPDVGGGFGPKAVVHPEEYVVAALSLRLGRPVKWVERRREHFTASIQQRGQTARVAVGFDGEGRVLALHAELIHDLGAYAPYGVVVPLTTLRLMSGPYRIPALHARLSCVFTNATPTGAIRGAGRPNATFVLERVMDAVARELGMDRAEVRRRNLIPPEALPYRLETIKGSDGRPFTYDSGDYPAALEAALEAADVAGFEARRAESESRGRLRGYGIASYVEDTGLGPYEGARMEILPTGEVVVELGAAAQGQGHSTVFAQICAEHLGVSPDRVRVRAGDTGRYPHGIGTVASRTGATAAAVVYVTAADLAAKVKQLAAAKLEAAVEDILLTEGVAMVIGQPGTGLPLGDLAAGVQPRFGGGVPGGDLPGLSAEKVLPFGGLAFTYGSHVAEVEVDPTTGHLRVDHYVVVHDCGTVLNPMIVNGQIDGGVAHGLGNALMEEVRYTPDGQPLTTSFMDYRLMTAADMPALTKVHLETPSPNNPVGAKGAGEGGTIPAAAAVVAAVEHALCDYGVVVDRYPITSEWVYRAIHG